MAHAAGVDVALLRSEVQVGRGAEAEVPVGVVLSLADLALVHELPVPGPGDVDYRRMEVVDKADKGVGEPKLHVLLRVDQGGGADCGRTGGWLTDTGGRSDYVAKRMWSSICARSTILPKMCVKILLKWNQT